MNTELKCPKCQCEYTYEQQGLWICTECAHEWSLAENVNNTTQNLAIDNTIRDAFGTILNDGDSVSVIKDLKIKGSSSSVKVGTKVKNIQLKESSDGHNISCKIDGFGVMNLKSEFVKKV